MVVHGEVLKRELVPGLDGGEGLGAVALVSFPGRSLDGPPELDRLRSEVWSELVPDARG